MIIDIGPEAGSFGGELVAQGTLMKFWNQLPSLPNTLMEI
jgi:excinuclease UvrABC ATPase subunit